MSFIFTCEETLELTCGNVIDDLLVSSFLKINVIIDLSHYALPLHINPDLEKRVRKRIREYFQLVCG